jgi:hypothetical protein
MYGRLGGSQNPTASVVSKKNSAATGEQSPVAEQKLLIPLTTSEATGF